MHASQQTANFTKFVGRRRSYVNKGRDGATWEGKEAVDRGDGAWWGLLYDWKAVKDRQERKELAFCVFDEGG